MTHTTTNNKLWTKNFTIMIIVNLLMAISFYFMTPVMPIYLKETFNVDEGGVGNIMFLFALTAILMRPLAGFLLDRSRRYTIYLLTLFLFGFLMLGYAFASTLTLVIIVRLIHGISWGGVNSAANTIVADLLPAKRRGEGFGYFGFSMTLAMAFAPSLAFYIAKQSSYQVSFSLAAAIVIVGLILAFFSQVKYEQQGNERRKVRLREFIDWQSMPVALIALLSQISYGGILAFIALYGQEIGINNSGPFFLIFALSIGIARVASGCIYDKIGAQKVVISGLSLIVVGLVLIGSIDSSTSFYLSGAWLGLGFGALSPSFQAMVNQNVPIERRGSTNSTYLMFFDSGIGIGMLLYGWLIKLIGYQGTFYTSAAITLLAICIFVLFTLPYFRKMIQ